MNIQGGIAAIPLFPIWLIALDCLTPDSRKKDHENYTKYGRFTDPGKYATMLDPLPYDPVAIASVAKNLSIHHNLLAYLNVPAEDWDNIQSI